MHWSLDPKKSLGLAALWAILAALLSWAARPFPLVQLEVGAVAGLVVGVLHRRSLAEAPDLYRAAATGAQVRRAMASTRSGRRAVGLQWVAALILLGVAMISVHGVDGRKGNPAFGLISGYLLLMTVRDLFSSFGLWAVRASEGRGGKQT